MFEKIKSFLFKNTTTRQTIAKNTFWLSVSNFGGRLIKAAVIIYAARALGTGEYGVFSYAVTLAGFLSLFMDPGINAVLMRDTAKSSAGDRSAAFSTTFVIKIGLIIIGLLVIIFIGPLISTLPGATALLPIVAFIMMFDTLREFFLSLLRGMEKMEWDAGIFIFTNIGIVIFGFIFMAMHPTAKALGWGYALGTGLGAIAASVVIWGHIKKTFSDFSKKLVLPILSAAWPFAVTGALGLLLTSTDILIISWIRTAADVGVYSAAIRIVQVLYLIPGVFQFSTLPLFSRLAKVENEKFRSALERIVGIVFLISVPLTVGGAILGTQLMSLLYGSAFTAGGLSLTVLMFSMLVDFPGVILANAVFTYGHQKSLIAAAAIGGISNVALDLILIPRFGIVGSAYATLIAQILSNGYLWYVMNKLNPFSVISRLKKIAFAAIIMGLAAGVLLLLGISVLLNIVMCVAIYFILLKVFREPLLEDAVSTFRPKQI